MNCQNFEEIIGDLARGALMDARVREEARAHEEVCARCAARLGDERSLSAGLRTLAATMRGAEAPAQVESALVAAFRARVAAGAGVTNTPERVVPLAKPARVRQWSWVKTVATAATAAAAAMVLFMLVPPGTYTPQPGGNKAEVAGLQPDDAGQSLTTMKAEGNPSGNVAEASSPTDDSDLRDMTPARAPHSSLPAATGSTRLAGRAMMINAGYKTRAGREARNPRGVLNESPVNEVATEFIPLAYTDPSAAIDAGQVVRVELPRSALSSLGLPLSGERAGERVKADVLVGEDGLARAIRFVR